MSLSFEKKDERKSEISVLNVLFCFMVIFIHITSYPLTNLEPTSLSVKVLHVFWRLCSCAVYGFIFLSGEKLFLKDKKSFSLKKFYVSRLKKIFIPYIIAVCFYYFYEIHRGYYSFSSFELLKFFLNGKIECHLYFVVIIMQFYLLMPIWQRLANFEHKCFWLFLFFVINIAFVYGVPMIFSSFEYNDRIFSSYIFFWVLGCFCGKNYESFLKIIKKHRAVIYLFFAVFSCFDVWFSYLCKFGRFYRLTETVHLLYCFSAILFFYALSICIRDKKFEKTKFFKNINGASYEIYLLHIFVLYKANDLIARYRIGGELKAWVFRGIFVYAVTIFVCVFYKYIKNLIMKRKNRV